MLMALALALPATMAVLGPLIGQQRANLREAATIATTLGLLAVIATLLGRFMAGDSMPTWVIATPITGLDLMLRIDALGIAFAGLASLLWVVTTLYSIGYMRGAREDHQSRFYACFAIAIAATMGLAFAGNMLTLFLFYEVLTVSTYPLVAHKGNDKARQGARTYLGLLLVTSIGFQLIAILATYAMTGTLEFKDGGILEGHVSHTVGAVLLVLYVYGVGKAALMPFHRWLPAAMVAPTPVSALLHAVAVVKAGVFTVIKIVVFIFGLDYAKALLTSDWLLYVAAFTVLAASIVAIQQDNLKARLAYSTISQLSYIIVGALLLSQYAAIGAGMHMVMHAFGKITLFFCAGAIYVASKKTLVSELDGLGRQMPFTMGAFFIGALCVIGVPPMGGVWSKWHLMMGAYDVGHVLIVVVLMVSTLLNVAYLLPPVIRAFLMPPRDEAAAPAGGLREAPLLCVAPLCFTALGCIALFFLVNPLYALMAQMFT
jgi:multicomponent Na+:H+ antiporter subunit D